MSQKGKQITSALLLYGEALEDLRGNKVKLAETKLNALLMDQPLFVSAMSALAAALQRGGDKVEPLGDAQAALSRAAEMLRQAVIASDRSPLALLELAFFISAVENDAESAEPLFLEALSGSIRVGKEAAEGLRSTFDELEDAQGSVLIGELQKLLDSVVNIVGKLRMTRSASE